MVKDMRRKDREIKDYNKMLKIIDQCDCIRIGFQEPQGTYILPLNFGYESQEDQLTFYFHGAKRTKYRRIRIRYKTWTSTTPNSLWIFLSISKYHRKRKIRNPRYQRRQNSRFNKDHESLLWQSWLDFCRTDG